MVVMAAILFMVVTAAILFYCLGDMESFADSCMDSCVMVDSEVTNIEEHILRIKRHLM